MSFNATEKLSKIKGKDYLEVKWRIVWVRSEHPDWGIETEIVNSVPGAAQVKATIKNAEGRILAQAHKMETSKGFPDYLEKAETGAIGRALALCGYGTQFTGDELDEGVRIVDAPVESTLKMPCKIHDEEMTERVAKTGKTYFAHDTDNGLCFGKVQSGEIR